MVDEIHGSKTRFGSQRLENALAHIRTILSVFMMLNECLLFVWRFFFLNFTTDRREEDNLIGASRSFGQLFRKEEMSEEHWDFGSFIIFSLLSGASNWKLIALNYCANAYATPDCNIRLNFEGNSQLHIQIAANVVDFIVSIYDCPSTITSGLFLY